VTLTEDEIPRGVAAADVGTSVFFHFCCDHSAALIRAEGIVKPMVGHPYLGGARLVWLTDLAEPGRDELGLTSETLSCDRTKWRVTVRGEAVWWPTWAHRHKIGLSVRGLLESYGQPRRWWVSEQPLSVLGIERVNV